MAWGPAWTDSGRVFTREDGTDLHPERVSELFDRLVKRSNLPRLTVHGLRHAHATLALEAGVHPKVVQERLGHSSVAFTLDRYSHAIGDAGGRRRGRGAACGTQLEAPRLHSGCNPPS